MNSQLKILGLLCISALGLISCNKSTTAAPSPSPATKAEKAYLILNIHDGVTTIPVEFNSSMNGEGSYSGGKEFPESLSYCYVGEVKLNAPYQQSRTVVFGKLIAFRYAKHNEAEGKDFDEEIGTLIFDGTNDVVYTSDDFSVTLSANEPE